MAATFSLLVVTPEREVLTEDAEMIIVRGAGGDLGILAHHIPLVTPLKPSILRIRQGEGEQRLAVTGGFLEVRGEQVTVLARTAERSEEVDRARAEAARERAEERLQAKSSDLDLVRAQDALNRALVRLQLVQEENHAIV